MSGFSDSTQCPNCDNDADHYTNWKPFDYSTIVCYHCGFMLLPKTAYMTLKVLNAERAAVGLEPLKKLPQRQKLEDIF